MSKFVEELHILEEEIQKPVFAKNSKGKNETEEQVSNMPGISFIAHCSVIMTSSIILTK